MAAEKLEQLSIAQRVRSATEAAASLVFTPPRLAVLVSVGSTVLATRAVRGALQEAADEGARQVERLNGSLAKATSRLWPWATKQEAKS